MNGSLASAVVTLIAGASLGCAGTIATAQPTNSPANASQELIVAFDSSASNKAERRTVERSGAVIESRSTAIDAALVKANSGKGRAEVEADLESSAIVRFVEPNFEVGALSTPNDPLFNYQWGLNAIAVPQALDLVQSSNPGNVAVIDTGLSFTHPDIAAHLWVNNGEVPLNGVDDDHNYVVDDVHGADFYNNDGDPVDDNGHGTHVSGIIGATTNNGQGIAGVGPNNRVLAIKFLSSSGSGTTWGAIRAINYAVAQHAKVINASWGGPSYSQSLRDAIHSAGSQGVLFVAAAGNGSANNDSQPFYPASYDEPNIISVAATTQSNTLASFSNYGAQSVDIGAPGAGILSTYQNGSYVYLSGTSMAAPHVAGAAALLEAENPTLGTTQLKEALLSTVDQLPALAGKSVSGGRLNVAAALQAAKPVINQSPPPSSTPPADLPTNTPGPSAKPASDFPGPFALRSPRNKSVINSARRQTHGAAMPVTFRWGESHSASGIASYRIVVDGRAWKVLNDPDGQSGPEGPPTKAEIPVQSGRHYWYVSVASWSGRSRLNTYAHGSAKRYFTVR